jgi:uncharacterized protein YndB with AHSA1/START domain
MSTEGKGQEEEEIIEIRKSIVIEASPEVVFKAITDPNELTNWFPDNAIFDGRIGGKVRFTFNKERSKELDRDYSPEGTIKEFILNKKVSYTWQLKDTPEFPETTITWELEEIDAIKREWSWSIQALQEKKRANYPLKSSTKVGLISWID